MNQIHGSGMHRRSSAGQTDATSGGVIHSARFYDALMFLMSFGREKRIRRTTIELAGVAPGQSVLDVGCGTGTLTLATKAAVGLSGRVSGIDPSPGMVEVARRKAFKAGADVDFSVGVVEALPFSDATFDVVLSSLMLHHLPKEVKSKGFVEIARVLRRGGLFFAVDLATGSPGRLHRCVGRLFGHTTGHTSHAELESAKQILGRVGFRDVAAGRMEFKFLVFLSGRRA